MTLKKKAEIIKEVLEREYFGDSTPKKVNKLINLKNFNNQNIIINFYT